MPLHTCRPLICHRYRWSHADSTNSSRLRTHGELRLPATFPAPTPSARQTRMKRMKTWAFCVQNAEPSPESPRLHHGEASISCVPDSCAPWLVGNPFKLLHHLLLLEQDRVILLRQSSRTTLNFSQRSITCMLHLAAVSISAYLVSSTALMMSALLPAVIQQPGE